MKKKPAAKKEPGASSQESVEVSPTLPSHPQPSTLNPQPSSGSPRPRSPRSIALQELVVLWQGGSLNGKSDAMIEQLGRLITDAIKRLLNRVKRDDTHPWGKRDSMQRISELEYMDLFQDSWVDVWNHLPTYNPVKAAITTFVNKRVDHVVKTAHRALGKQQSNRKKLAHVYNELVKSDQNFRTHATEFLQGHDPLGHSLIG